MSEIEIDHQLGAALKGLRVAAGLTQEGLAERAGISARTVSDLERGLRTAVHYDTAKRIASALGLDEDRRRKFEALARGRVFRAPSIPTAGGLPSALTPLLGRSRELDGIKATLLAGRVRLLTLTGPGGIGKTRLALEAAREIQESFPDGCFFVSLGEVKDASLVAPELAKTIGVAEAGPSLEQLLIKHLAGRRFLIVLDTLEHLVAAASDLAEVLGGASKLRLLVTSRIPLHISAEFEYPVDPLSATNATTLFVERARAVGRELSVDATVNEICARLDNLPLALELAAARTKLLDPASLLARLERRLPLLAGGPSDVPERQRTLRAAIAWSYDLLDEDAKALFRRLTVFAGGFSLEAAEEVGDAELDVLSRLVDASLLKSVGHGRLLMLDTIREYGLERLEEAGEAPGTRDRHAAHFARLADRRWPDLVRADDPTWTLSTVQLDVRNLHSAVEWSLERGQAEEILAIGSGMYPF